MATFAPEPPKTNDPLYIGWSKEIQQPESDKSSAYAMSAMGDALEIGAKGVDYSIQQGIKKGLEEDLRPLIDQRTAELQDVDAQVRGQQPTTQSLLDSPTKPDTTKSMQDTVNDYAKAAGTIQTVRKNGRISETDYIGRIYTVNKDYRDRYPSPAYRNLIDKTSEEITGIPSANAYIKSILGDINTFVGQKDELKNKVLGELASQAFHGSAAVAKDLQENKITVYDAMRWQEQRKGDESEMKLAGARIDAANKNREGISNDAEIPVLRHLNNIANFNLDNINFNMKQKDPSGKVTDHTYNLKTLMEQAGEDGSGLNGQQWLQVAATFRTNTLAVEQQMRQSLMSKKDKNGDPVRADGLSWYEAYGATKAEAAIKTAMSLHKTMEQGAAEKDAGLAFMPAHQATAILSDGGLKLLGEPEARKAAIVLNAVKTWAGPGALGETVKDSILGNTTKKLSDKLTQGVLKTLGQVGDDLKPTRRVAEPVATTMSTLSSDVATKNINDPGYQQAVATLPPKLILNPKIEDDGKVNAFRSFISDKGADPNNPGKHSVFNFNKSSIDENGRKITGQSEYFANLTSEPMAAEAKRLTARDPDLLPTYKNWTERTFTRLYRTEAKDLDNILQNSRVIGLDWNPNTNQVEAKVRRQPLTEKEQYLGADQRDPRITLQKVNESVSRLNMGLTGLANVAKASGEKDIGGYLTKVLQQQGVDLRNMGDTSGQIMKSIRSQYAEEDPEKGSLSGFLANPGGTIPGGGNNAPAGSLGAPRGNLGEILGMKVDDIPEGMSARDFIKQLKKENKF